ncbi:MAG: BatA and WFA domain-containing protein [Pirellulaceae bacterium]
MGILEFANPIGFWWAFVALPIIAFFILKVRVRRVPVTTLLFWNQLYDEKKPRSWWQRLRHWLSLLLQLAFLVLLVGALVDPLWSWQKSRQKRIVVIIDNSASMQAVDAQGKSRMELAQEAAHTLVRSMRDRDEMALVAAGGRPKVVWGMTNHGRWLKQAIDELNVTDAPSAIETSVELARRLLSGLGGENDIVVITDGCSGNLQPLVDTKQIRLLGVGEKLDNLGITRYQVRRSLIDAISYQVLVDVSNFSEEKRSCRLELDLNGDLVDVLPLELEPNQTVTRIVDHTSAAGGVMTAKLNIEDSMDLDNLARAVLPTRKKTPVTLVSEGNLFVFSALGAMPLVELTTTNDLAAVSANTQAIQVFDRKVPEKIPAGRVLVIDPQNDCELWTIQKPIEQPIVAAVDGNSPITQHVRLDNVIFPGAKQIEFKTKIDKLIRDPLDQALLARISRPGGDVIVLTCNLDQGELPLRIAFPVLIKNCIEWFQGDAGELRPAAATGELVSVDVRRSFGQEASAKIPEPTTEGNAGIVVESSVATNTASYELLTPDGVGSPIATGSGVATIGPLLDSGVWVLRPLNRDADVKTPAENKSPANGETQADDAEPSLQIACNLTSTEESDLRPRFEIPKADELSAFGLGGRSIWFYLTLLAAGLTAIEWWLYQRRIIG